MRVLLCDTDDCQIIVFAESDEGTTRCPGCGFLGERLRSNMTGRAGQRQLIRRLLYQRGTTEKALT